MDDDDLLRLYDPSHTFPALPEVKARLPEEVTPTILPVPVGSTIVQAEDHSSTVRRQLFPSQERKLKSIEEIRRKRKRYRANKKKIFNSWKKKSEQYQQSVISEQIEHKEELKRQDEKNSFRAERKRLENDREKKRKAIIENVYWSVACNSINEETEPLLLPACNSSTETSILPCSEPSNAEMSSPFKRIDTAVYIKKLKKERETALQDARIYRNLAERIRKEKREAINQLALKCEVIRDRWRNELLEGGSQPLD